MWIVLVCTCQLEACSSSRPVFRHTTEQEPFPLASMISFCLSFFLSFRVWLRGKHFHMVLEQRRFSQLLHWQAFSNKENDTCSIVASHCVIKQDVWGAGIAQWLERRTRDWKIAGSNPCRSGGRILFSRVSFRCWLLFWYPCYRSSTWKTPVIRVTTVARKRPRSFCQRCRWQVTGKHACTLRVWLCMKWHGAWLYDIHRTRRDGRGFMRYQPCYRCKYATSVDIYEKKRRSFERAIKKLFANVESLASAVSLLESGVFSI